MYFCKRHFASEMDQHLWNAIFQCFLFKFAIIYIHIYYQITLCMHKNVRSISNFHFLLRKCNSKYQQQFNISLLILRSKRFCNLCVRYIWKRGHFSNNHFTLYKFHINIKPIQRLETGASRFDKWFSVNLR